MQRVIQDIIQDRHQLTVTHDIARKARKKALEMINDEFDQQFASMKEYKATFLCKFCLVICFVCSVLCELTFDHRIPVPQLIW